MSTQHIDETMPRIDGNWFFTAVMDQHVMRMQCMPLIIEKVTSQLQRAAKGELFWDGQSDPQIESYTLTAPTRVVVVQIKDEVWKWVGALVMEVLSKEFEITTEEQSGTYTIHLYS